MYARLRPVRVYPQPWIVAVSVKGPKHDTMPKDRKRCSLRDRRVPIPNSLTASPDRQHSAR